MPTVYGYMRASTSGQQYTYEAQEKAIRDYYEAILKPKGFVMGEIFQDKATSGTTKFAEREGGRSVYHLAKTGDCIVWSKLDRAFRNIRDGAATIHELQEKGVSIHSLDIALDTSTPLGGFVLHLLVLLASLERSWISERTKVALKTRKGQRNRCRPPYGWKAIPVPGMTTAGGRQGYEWIPDELQRKVLDWCAQQLEKRWTWDQIVAKLTEVGSRTNTGKLWSRNTLWNGLQERKENYPGVDGSIQTRRYGTLKRGEGHSLLNLDRIARGLAPIQPGIYPGRKARVSSRSSGLSRSVGQKPAS